MSFRSLGHPDGNNFYNPSPFFEGKFIYIWEAWDLNRYKTSAFGVPITLCILWIWSN